MMHGDNNLILMTILTIGVLETAMPTPLDKPIPLVHNSNEDIEGTLFDTLLTPPDKNGFVEDLSDVGLPARVVKSWHGGKKVSRYRNQRQLVDRGRKIKFMRRESSRKGHREQGDTNVYVVDETVTGYAPNTRTGENILQGQHSGFLDPAEEIIHVWHRLQKLDFYFEFMRIMSEDCRQRMLCEVAREPARFYPLSSVLDDVTSFTGSIQYVTSHLINTTEGARLLSYMEASFRGQDRARSCSVFQYRCPSRTEEMINYEALCLWREMVRWLTIHVVAQPQF